MRSGTWAIAAMLILISSVAWSQSSDGATSRFSLAVDPEFSIPLGEDGGIFGYGGGADLSCRWGFKQPSFLSLQMGLGYTCIPIQAAATISLVSASAGARIEIPVGKKLSLGGSIRGGYFYSFLHEDSAQSGHNPCVMGGVDVSFALSPAVSLEAGVTYRSYLGFYNDVAASLGTSIRLLPRKLLSSPQPLPELLLGDIQFDSLFPVFYKFYDDHQVGKATIRNDGKEPVENLKVSLFIKQYMDNPKTARSIPALKPGEEAEIVFYGLFNERVLEISEDTKVSAQITVTCMKKGVPHTNEQIETIRMHSRNSMTWEDDRRAAAFVTLKDPTVLRFSKNVAGATKGIACSAIPGPLQQAIGLHEALALYGLSYVTDPTSPYAERSKARTVADYLQFPKHTLEYKAGDCDDLAILSCALLESVGIETAFITVPDHIFMALSLNMDPQEASAQFLRPEDLIIAGGKTWLPVEVTEIGGGFLAAWQSGARQWREQKAKGQAALFPLHEAWELYEPVGFSGEAEALALPPEKDVVAAFAKESQKFVDREISSRIAQYQEEIRKSQNDPKAINRLGVLYARYCLADKARAEFRKIADRTDFVPALINLGNLFFLDGSMSEAQRYYERASRAAPDNPKVLLGLARVYHAMENYGSVKPLYERLSKIDPMLAERFSYLGLKGDDAVRAAQSSGLMGSVAWEE